MSIHARLAPYKSLVLLALPVALQTAIFSSKSTVDTIMLASLSEIDIAAIGLAAKAQMVISFFIIGLSIGGGQVAAQCFGIKTEDGPRKLHTTVLITLLLSLATALFFFTLLFFFPHLLMGLGSQSQDIINKGAIYLQTIAVSLFCFAYASSIASGLRAMHQPAIATKISFIGVGLNLLLNWLLIFGHFGFPAMGIEGAALGTAISAVIECIALYLYLLVKEHPLTHFRVAQFVALKYKDIKVVARLSVTAAVNAVIWAAGLFAFHAILGFSDPNLLIALSVLAPLEAFAMSLLIGLSTAGSILIGNMVGANKLDELPQAVRLHLYFSAAVGVVTALVLSLLESPLLSLFFHAEVPSDAQKLTSSLFSLMAASLIIKSISMMLIVGVLRAGGDAMFCLMTDVFAQWIFLLPCAFLLTHVFNYPPQYLLGLVIIEEYLKAVICGWRLKGKRWVKNVAADLH